MTVEQIQSRVCMSPCSAQTAAELLLFYRALFFGAEEFPKLFSGLVLASILASFGTRDVRTTWGPSSNVLMIDWLVDAGAQLWILMLSLKKSTIWPQKLVAEVLS